MLVSRRIARLLTLVCATAALAVAPAGALARPAQDPFVAPGAERAVVDPPSAPVVRGSDTGGGDTTLVLVLAAGALLLVAGGAGVAGRRHQRVRHLA
jgi:hypothetical protein